MLSYYPALRFKQGEYFAGARLAPDIQQHICPRFVIPPPKENDPEKGRPLTADELAYLTADRIGKHWPIQPAFLDPHYIAPFTGEEGLARMLRIARKRNEKLGIVVRVPELHDPLYREFLRSSPPRIGVYLHYETIDVAALLQGIAAIGCIPADCLLFVDFTGAALDIEGASSSVAAVFDLLGTAAQWHRIVFQGSSFPAKNPAKDCGSFLVPRHEWRVFHSAVAECSILPAQLGYGDYGADCGEINFPRKGGGRAIRHIRYTGEREFLVVRGASLGKDAAIMKEVCQRVLDSGHYSGQGFSYADDRIWRTAKGLDGPGNASNWREWNMAHHMTRVVRDLGTLSGIKFADVKIREELHQHSMFEDELPLNN